MKPPWMVVAGFVAIVATAGAFGIAAGLREAQPTDPTRLVGRGQFVVEVPKNWTTGDDRCTLPGTVGAPLSGTVMFWHVEEGSVMFCRGGHARARSFVEIEPFRVPEPRLRAREHQAVVTSRVDDARIIVASADPVLVGRIVASAHRLPDGWTTVPALASGHGCEWRKLKYHARWGRTEWAECIRKAELIPKVSFNGPRRAVPPALRISPREGSAVRRGSTVTIRLPASARDDQ